MLDVIVMLVQPVQDADGEHRTPGFTAVTFRPSLHRSGHCKFWTFMQQAYDVQMFIMCFRQ